MRSSGDFSVEFLRDSQEEIDAIAKEMEALMRSKNLGYQFPELFTWWSNKVRDS